MHAGQSHAHTHTHALEMQLQTAQIIMNDECVSHIWAYRVKTHSTQSGSSETKPETTNYKTNCSQIQRHELFFMEPSETS